MALSERKKDRKRDMEVKQTHNDNSTQIRHSMGGQRFSGNMMNVLIQMSTTVIHDHNHTTPSTLITTTVVTHLDNRLASFRIVGIRGELSVEQADALFTVTGGGEEISVIIIRRVKCGNTPREENSVCVWGEGGGWSAIASP